MTIVPDGKDWTWVLDHPCPDCGFDAADVTRDDVPGRIRALGTAWREVLGRDTVAVRPGPDRWSPLEYGCHVRDVFRIFDGRLRLMVGHDGATFDNWDQDATAVDERYDLQDPGTVATEVVDAADCLADRFADVTGDQWDHRGVRSNGSAFTVSTFAAYLLHDPVHHLWDVSC